jgi:hypothetical protein
VGNNPLKYIDPTGDVKVIPADINLANYEIDELESSMLTIIHRPHQCIMVSILDSSSSTSGYND